MIEYIGAYGDKGKDYPDNEIMFDDGILYIVNVDEKEYQSITIDPEYSKPISLWSIAPNFNSPYGEHIILIYENYSSGIVFRYGNHGKGWETVGTTIGFV